MYKKDDQVIIIDPKASHCGIKGRLIEQIPSQVPGRWRIMSGVGVLRYPESAFTLYNATTPPPSAALMPTLPGATPFVPPAVIATPVYQPGDIVIITKPGSRYFKSIAKLIKTLPAPGLTQVWEVAIDGKGYGPKTPYNQFMETSFEMLKASKYPSQMESPKHLTIQQEWKQEGRCPKCGELGRYSMSVPICSKHGEY